MYNKNSYISNAYIANNPDKRKSLNKRFSVNPNMLTYKKFNKEDSSNDKINNFYYLLLNKKIFCICKMFILFK